MTPLECRTLIDAAPAPLKAMILLGLNCGFGPRDCALLPTDAVDLPNRMIEFPRPKTGVERRCSLWPETVEAVKDAIAKRPSARSESTSKLVFRTIADGAKDQPATDYIMGHADDSMAANYRASIDDERLIAVTDHVRAWLISKSTSNTSRKPTPK